MEHQLLQNRPRLATKLELAPLQPVQVLKSFPLVMDVELPRRQFLRPLVLELKASVMRHKLLVTSQVQTRRLPASSHLRSNHVVYLYLGNVSNIDYSIPRPEVVKRVRPDTKTGDFQKPILDTTSQERADAESSERRSQIPSQDSRTNHKDDNLTPTRPGSALSRSRYNSPITGIDSSQSLLPASNSSLGATSTGSHPPSSLRNSRPTDDKALRTDSNPVMPPPSIPSQTQSAHELRETAKQTIIRPDKFDDRGSRLTVEPRSQNASAAPSPRPRSSSPHSRPGTRNPSNESRASGGRSRSDRGTVDDAPGDRRSDRENRSDSRDHATAVSRRDSITHNRGDRVGRDRTSMRDDDRKDADRDKDRDRGRDRHGDRHNDREREKERERDKEKDRERDRDRDRHRRDEKDRDRDSRKDREVSNRNSAGNAPPPPGDRALPTRPDPTRHRSVQNGDDVLGKRRRLAEDDVSYT